VVSAVIDPRRPLREAVEMPRLHWDGERIQAEPGWAEEAVHALRERWEVNDWDRPDLYFGGVHAVVPGRAAAGDPRRGGAELLGW
jgi:gamma-glutamyltranspeptidase / glutathione hydrolase